MLSLSLFLSLAHGLKADELDDKWHKAFNFFISIYRPDMPGDAKAFLSNAIWDGTNRNLSASLQLLAMCDIESSFKVRRYYPEVKQRTDYLGTHNCVLFKELRLEGYITDAKEWRKSKQFKAWRNLFKLRPDIGTMIACRWFMRLIRIEKTIPNAVEVWNVGRIHTKNGHIYLRKVYSLRTIMDGWLKPQRFVLLN